MKRQSKLNSGAPATSRSSTDEVTHPICRKTPAAGANERGHPGGIPLQVFIEIRLTESGAITDLLLLQLGKRSKHFFTVRGRLHAQEHLRDVSLRIDDECVALRQLA